MKKYTNYVLLVISALYILFLLKNEIVTLFTPNEKYKIIKNGDYFNTPIVIKNGATIFRLKQDDYVHAKKEIKWKARLIDGFYYFEDQNKDKYKVLKEQVEVIKKEDLNKEIR